MNILHRLGNVLDFSFREDPRDVLFVLGGRAGIQRLKTQVRRERYRFFQTGHVHADSLGRFLGVSANVIRRYADEATSVVATIARQWPPTEGNLGHLKGAVALFIVTRLAAPESVVETGVASGISSTFILDALERNAKGTLYSIDVKNYDDAHIPEEMPTGAMIPGHLRERWRLVQGNSGNLLPQLLADIGPIDMFLHDSLHTAAHMQWEYTVAWEALRRNGLLLSDNVERHHVFRRFCASHHAPSIIAHSVWRGPRLGVAKKP